MKFTVLKSVFMNVLTPAMGTVSNKNTITSIEGVLIETLESGDVRISTYDMEKGVRATFTPTSIEEDGKFIINAQRLYQTVRVLPEDELTIEVNEKLNCIISCGKASFSMFASNGADFPNLPELYSERGFTIESSSLKNVIGKVSHSISTADNNNRVMLRGAFFKIKEGEMEVVSCDNYTLSKCTLKCDIGALERSEAGNNEIDYSFIIPGTSLSELVKMLSSKDDEKATVYLSRKHAIVKCDNVIFFSRTIDSDYIDYKRILPKENDIHVVVEKERFLSGLERANIIAEEKIQGSGRSYVKISVEGQSLTLTSTSVNGKVSDEMDCVHEGGDIEIAFNCRYLINSVRVAEGENVVLTFKDPKLAITIEPEVYDDDYDYIYMIQPVRMTER